MTNDILGSAANVQAHFEKNSAPFEQTFDAFTAAHLEKWLENTVRDDIRERVRDLMLAEFANDPVYYVNEGWTVLYNRISDLIDFNSNSDS